MLPYLEQAPLYAQVVFTHPDAPENAAVRAAQIPFLKCPMDEAPRPVAVIATTNYVANCGSGVHVGGKLLGMFRVLQKSDVGSGTLATRDVSDGLSTTVAFSEVLHASGTKDRIRTTWFGPRHVDPDEFVAGCEMVDLNSQVGDSTDRGFDWTDGNAGMTLYNHLQTPNHMSCTNKGSVLEGCYPPTSNHSGGVNTCLADGSTKIISDAIDRSVWRAIGTRAGGEVASSF